MAGSIIDADKLQNKIFVRYNWLVGRDGRAEMIVLHATENEVSRQCKILSSAVRATYTYKKIVVHWKDKV